MGTSPANFPRLILSLCLGSAIVFPTLYQPFLNRIYDYLFTSPIYLASTFETLWTVICYAIIEPAYTFKYAHSPQLRLAVQKDAGTTKPIPKLRRPQHRIKESLTYIAPLLLFDLTMIKKFSGVPVHDMAISGNYDPNTVSLRGNFLAPSLHRFTLSSPLQIKRALPHAPPTSRQLILQLATSILIYDTVFFFFPPSPPQAPYAQQDSLLASQARGN